MQTLILRSDNREALEAIRPLGDVLKIDSSLNQLRMKVGIIEKRGEDCKT